MERGRLSSFRRGSEADERTRGDQPSAGDTAEGSRQAAEQAETRAADEIVALEEDLEKAKSEATEALGVIESRVAEAEQRAREAEERAAAAAAQLAEEREKAAERAENTAEARRTLERQLARDKASVEAELAAVRRELEEAHAQAAELERRALAAGQRTSGEVTEKVTEGAVHKRVYEIAREQGVGSKEVLQALSAAGIEAWAASSVDEGVALQALADTRRAEAEPPAEPEPESEPEPEPSTGPASFAELAEEAEKLAPAAPADSGAFDLEPPDWVVEAEPEPEPVGESESESESEPSAGVPDGPTLSLTSIEFDELRDLGMSVTQAKRVLRYRDERGGFRSLDELDNVPGFPKGFLTDVKRRLVP
jgi:Translation initiation factor IF-2, N-terminal region/Helix-hairpin-helix motif